VLNSGAPPNTLHMWGIELPDGSVHATGCRFSGRFADGPLSCGILLSTPVES
jgi:hypothetical protein